MRISDWSSDVCSSDLYPRCYRVSPAQMGNRPPYASGCSGGGSRQRDVRISASVDAGRFQAPKHSMTKGYRRPMKRENAAECFCKVVGTRLISEVRRIGTECVSTCSSGRSPSHKKKKKE